MDILKQVQLNQLLLSLGKAAPLKREFRDLSAVKKQVRDFEKHFKPYNPRKPGYNRYGLSITSLDGGFAGVPDLDSINEYNRENGTSYSEGDFREKTLFFKSCEELREIMAPFESYMGRSHILRLNKGGFFPTHRDSIAAVPKSFRLLLSAADTDRFVFLLDSERLFLAPGQLYYLNTRLAHAVFSFIDKTDLFVFNIDLCEESVAALTNHLAAA